MASLFDEIADWTYGTVLSTDNSTQFTVVEGEGELFPTPVNGYYVAVWPINIGLPLLQPAAGGAAQQVEVFRISAGGLSDDTFTWSARRQLGTPTRTILVGDQVAAVLTAEQIAAVQNSIGLTPQSMSAGQQFHIPVGYQISVTAGVTSAEPSAAIMVIDGIANC